MLHYIIDGYNVIKSEYSQIYGGSLERQRNTLIALIKSSSPQGSSKNMVTVVFDGKTEDPFSSSGYSRQMSGFIEVLYSENATADKVIEIIVNESSNSSNMVVVTDDRGIHKLLGYSGAKFVSTRDFCRKLFNTKKGNPREENIDTDFSESIDKELKEKWFNEK
ncbi:MAG: NYN domain-containing protein [Elusimicrobia bacterium]|nr:NYN domain-containing protein [Elusimicrobiota bacterium]